MAKVPEHLHSRPPMQRMMVVHKLLNEGAYPNKTTIARAIETSTKTVKRDLDFMRDRLLLPLEYDKKRQGFYYTKPVTDFPAIVVSEAELFALLVAQKAVAHYKGTPLHRPLETAFRKLSGNLENQAILRVENLGAAVDIRVTGPEDLDPETFEVLCRAVQERQAVRYQYRKHATKGKESRRLNPYQIVCVNNRWYVVGHDLNRRDMRIFVLSRMEDVEIVGGTFERPADFNVEEYLKGSFGIFRGRDDIEVVIDLDMWAADVLRGRSWHASQQATELPGGEMRLCFHLDNLEEIEPWVLSWGAHATVVRPKLLADRVLQAALLVQQRYAEPAIASKVDGHPELLTTRSGKSGTRTRSAGSNGH